MKKQTDPKREKSYDEVAAKLQAWQEDNPKATLTEIETAVDTELAKLRRRIVEEMAQEREAAEPNDQDCPQCGHRMVKNGKKKRRLKTKEGQEIALTRQQLRCLHCGMTFFPPG